MGTWLFPIAMGQERIAVSQTPTPGGSLSAVTDKYGSHLALSRAAAKHFNVSYGTVPPPGARCHLAR